MAALYTSRARLILSLEETQLEAVKAAASKKTWPVTTWIQEAIREKLKRESKHE